jgi:hypothetical protein
LRGNVDVLAAARCSTGTQCNQNRDRGEQRGAARNERSL